MRDIRPDNGTVRNTYTRCEVCAKVILSQGKLTHLLGHVQQPKVRVVCLEPLLIEKALNGELNFNGKEPERKAPLKIKIRKVEDPTKTTTAFKVVPTHKEKWDTVRRWITEFAEMKTDPESNGSSSAADSGILSPTNQDSPTTSELLRAEGLMPHSPEDIQENGEGHRSPITDPLKVLPDSADMHLDGAFESGNISPKSGISDVSTEPVMSLKSEPVDSTQTVVRPKLEDKSQPAASEDDEGASSGSERASSVESKPSITLRPPSELLAPAPTNGQDTFSALHGLVQDIKPSDPLKLLSQVDLGLVNGGSDSSSACDVCGDVCANGPLLEQHKSLMGHYRCVMSAECATGQLFPSRDELGNHQSSAHSSPMQHLAQQVQRIPMSPQYQQYPVRSHQTLGGGQVVMSASVPQQMPQMPNLPPGVQLSKRPAPPSSVPQGPPQQAPPPAKLRRTAEQHDQPQLRLPESITLMRPGLSSSVSITQAKPKDNTSAVADMLATRGITVVPSSGGARVSSGGSVSVTPTRRNSGPSLPPSISSAVSITPSSQRGRGVRGGNSPAVSPRLPTVDLTQESGRGGAGGRTPAGPPGRRSVPAPRLTCQVCDKGFPSQETLNAHLQTHRQPGGPNRGTPSKLPFECNLCTAQYPTQGGLIAHKQKYHAESATDSPEVGIPVVDLRQPGVSQRLSNVGVTHMIPLPQLHNQGNGLYGIPILPVQSARNPAQCNIGLLGASNLFPLGPLKTLR